MADLKLTDEQMQEVLEVAATRIREEAVKGAIASLKGTVEHYAQSAISKTVQEFMTEHVVPEILKELMGHKPELVRAGVLAAQDSSTLLREAFVESFTTVLKDQWKRKALFKQMFDL